MKTQSFIDQDLLFFRLETGSITPSIWRDFIITHCLYIYIGPWLVEGSVVTVEQLELWNPDAHFGIVLAANNGESLDETIIHELVHIFLHVLGVVVHPEDKIENLCVRLSKKYPWILDVIREVFPGLSFSEEFLCKTLKSPVCIYLPVGS